MKTLKQFFSFVMIATAVLFAFASCTHSPEELVQTEISIQYNTGEATWSPTDPQTLELNKRGVSATGSVPYLIVTSNNYWIIEGASDYDWLEVSPLGGSGTTNVYLTLSENTDLEPRDATIYFVTQNGERFVVPIRQLGNKEYLVYLNDTFGDNLEEDTQVKFYSFTTMSGDRSYSGIATAGDLYAFGYTGAEQTYASVDEPSHGYVDIEGNEASGGANILFNGEGTYLTARNFNNQSQTNFRLSFGAKNSDGRFNTEDLKLYISCDNKNYAEMPYNHVVNEVNDWSLNTFNFSIAPNVSNILYFKFENHSTDAYRIDDFRIVEKDYDENDQFYELISTGSDIIGLPVTWAYNDLKSGDERGQNWEQFGIVYSAEGTDAHVQFVCGSDASIVKERAAGDGLLVTSSSPKVTGMYEGDFWIWTIPVHKVSAMTNMNCQFVFMSTDAGPKYFLFESAQCLAEDYPFANANIVVLSDEEKREFYNTLDWTVYDETTIAVPNDVDKAASSSGIPIGSSSSPGGYFKGDIVYSNDGVNVFAGGPSSKQVTIDKNVLYPEAMDDGYFFVRLRCASNLTAGPTNSTSYQRMNKNDHNGTSYLRQVARFSFAECGVVGEYEDTFKLLALYNNLGWDNGYDGGDILFNVGAKMGLYAGAEANLEATTAGNNQFSGICPTNQSGSTTYVYYPYDSSNTSDLTQVAISVPLSQSIASGALVADSAPFVMTNTPQFKTTSTIRCNLDVMAALLKLNIFSQISIANKISTIEVSSDTNIAGSRYYDLNARAWGADKSLAKSFVAKANVPIVIPTANAEPAKTYMSLLPGTHTLTVKVVAGGYSYTKTFPATEFTEAMVSTLEFDLSTVEPEPVDGEVKVGITDAAMLRRFVEAIQSGKTGSDLDEFRNSDGNLALGADIDMAGVDMNSWPLVTIPEDFNGCNFRIKNMEVKMANTSLFTNIAKGCTFSNLIFDESCKLTITDPNSTYAMLFTGSNTMTIGNIDNVINYGTMDISGNTTSTFTAGMLIGSCRGADSDADSQAKITNCANYGRIYIHDVTQTATHSSSAYQYYSRIGGIAGHICGAYLQNCNNYGEIVLAPCDRRLGAFDLGGVVGYLTNRSDANTSNMFGELVDSKNYGNVSITSGSGKMFDIRFGGMVGRTQWAHLTRLTNEGDINVDVTMYDTFGQEGAYGGWDTYSSSSSFNHPIGIFIGGIFAFAQCNIATGAEHNYLENTGDITAHINMPGTFSVKDNVGVCVGGVMAIMGANAYNPHFNNCANTGNITVTSEAATADVYVGGILGRMASNKYDSNYVYTLNGSSNIGTISFATETADVVAHVGGIIGGFCYGELKANVNAGAVINKSTNENSSAGSILGKQMQSKITGSTNMDPAISITSHSVGGSVNGVVLDENNFEQYIYGKYENYEPALKDNTFFKW